MPERKLGRNIETKIYTKASRYVLLPNQKQGVATAVVSGDQHLKFFENTLQFSILTTVPTTAQDSINLPSSAHAPVIYCCVAGSLSCGQASLS